MLSMFVLEDLCIYFQGDHNLFWELGRMGFSISGRECGTLYSVCGIFLVYPPKTIASYAHLTGVWHLDFRVFFAVGSDRELSKHFEE